MVASKGSGLAAVWRRVRATRWPVTARASRFRYAVLALDLAPRGVSPVSLPVSPPRQIHIQISGRRHQQLLPHRPESYAAGMGDPTLSPDEIRAAAQVHDELGPEYRDAVVESFLAKIDKQVAARIDAQLDAARPARDRARDPALMEKRRAQLGAAAVGSAITAMASVAAYAWWEHYPGSSLGKALLFAWTVLAVAYIVYAWRLRRR
jgi:hypothetical protein